MKQMVNDGGSLFHTHDSPSGRDLLSFRPYLNIFQCIIIIIIINCIALDVRETFENSHFYQFSIHILMRL